MELMKVQRKAGNLVGVGALVEIAKGVHLDTEAQTEGEALKEPNEEVEAETGMGKIVVTKREVIAKRQKVRET